MAQIALPRQQVTQTPPPSAASPLSQRRCISNAGPIELIPNPDFTFPQRYADESTAPTAAPRARPMSLQSYPSGRRGSAPGLRQKSVSALPVFSFNPAGPAKPSGDDASPPHSPIDTLVPPSRPGGHRRGGSEFIGGDARAGGIPPLVSSSPTRTDDVLVPPSANIRSGPPGGRRGHAHRRSNAGSVNDLAAIMKGPSQSGSAPATPAEGNPFAFGHTVNKSVSQPSLRDTGASEDPSASPQRPPLRPRVKFDPDVEYINRPLSTISSGTETSVSTLRGHSTTNSLSSIVSTGASTPPRLSRPSLNTTVEIEGRPSTAGAILDASPRKSPQLGTDRLSRKRPVSAISAASPTVTPSHITSREPGKRRSFFRLERRRSDPLVRLPTSISDPALPVSLPDLIPSPAKDDVDVGRSAIKNKSTSRKSGLKPRKVKSWANSIISRTGKHSGKPKKRAPTPPLRASVDAEEDSSGSEDWDIEPNFDEDNTVTIVSELESAATQARNGTHYASWQPRTLTRVDSEPKIDIDVLLGPFDTPNGLSSRTQRGFGAHRRALHSANGPGQSHRRTESAPELVPFEFRNFAMGTTSTMADVFEEEEPEDDTIIPSPVKSKAETEVIGEEPKIQVVEGESSQNGSAINWNFDDGLCIKHGHRAREETLAPLSPLQVPLSVPEQPVARHSLEVSPVEVVEDYEEPRTSSLTHSSDSTVTPQLGAVEPKEHHPVMSMSLPLPQQTLMTPGSITSSFSSPGFDSEASFDRLGTSTSSMTDYQALPSPHFGEPGPEVRVSSDVPSLSSSRSTMTSAMQNAFPMLESRRPSERSSSMCSAPSELDQRRRKRSSIASLSRLINGSSFGEKSKLSIEQRPQSEHMESTRELKKKHKRLSKLMFWKPKDGPQNERSHLS